MAYLTYVCLSFTYTSYCLTKFKYIPSFRSVQHAGSTMTPMVGALLTLAPHSPVRGKGLSALLSRFHLPALVLFLTALVCILLLLMVFEDRADLATPPTEENVAFGAEHVPYAAIPPNPQTTDTGKVKSVRFVYNGKQLTLHVHFL